MAGTDTVAAAAWVAGQRLASHADPDLGLGVVTETDGRRLGVYWPAVDEHRIYAIGNAPLTRIRYHEEDRIRDAEGREYRVIQVEEARGLLTYLALDSAGRQHHLPEADLDSHARFTTPRQRLFSGQLDAPRRYQLRVETLLHRHRLQHSPVRGLLGARTSLLPHQIHIAGEVARRHAPRVLLADEVGLGKTIEAGLILHRQVLTGQAERVLILVPESLLHQWLVEMLRRFNLAFSIYDEERLRPGPRGDETDDEALPEPADNPFEREQRIICSLEFLAGAAEVQAQVLGAHWDMVVVDEAHHLRWSPESASPEYRCVEALARQCEGLLLLTATPEQAGQAGHFARLRLLDPARFHDLAAFEQEESGYAAVNRLVTVLQEDPAGLSADARRELQALVGSIDSAADNEALIDILLDRHGTGRVLFRNSRRAVQGFPRRLLRPYPLRADAAAPLYGQAGLYPERQQSGSQWPRHDPRVIWLVGQLRSLRGEKVLVICHHAATAIDLEHFLSLGAGLRCALFHEGMSIVERDRAAAYFAEADSQGAQVLVCSEIGSEGRNFQFAQHLVLFDLPPDPDLIEQRIGRLDRIGQQQNIWIHLPYLEDSAQAVLFRWLHEGLNLFEQSCSAGYAIHAAFAERLSEQLQCPDSGLDALIAETRAYAEDIRRRQEAGRDRLLELNSCRPASAQRLISLIEAEEQSDTLEDYMGRVFDEYGLDQEVHSERCLILTPGSHMHGEHFPGLDADGVTVTFSRSRALAREDMAFLSWEHPMVDASMEMIIASEFGNACVAAVEIDALKPGVVLLETIHTLSAPAPRRLQLERYLPAQPLRRLLLAGGKDLTDSVSHQRLNQLCQTLPADLARQVVTQLRSQLEQLLDSADAAATQALPKIKAQASKRMQDDLGRELDRLQALRKLNPGVRESELAYLRRSLEESAHAIDRADVQLQAVRLVISR